MAFDTYDTDAIVTSGVAFSGGSLTATCSAGSLLASRIAQSKEGKTSGKWYVEFTCSGISGNVDGVGIISSIGVGGAGFLGNNEAGISHDMGWGYYTNSHVPNQGVTQTSVNNTTWGSGDVIGLAIDLDNKRVWFNKNGGSWVGTSGTPNPATNTSGFDITDMLARSQHVYPAANMSGSGAVFTANFGATSFTGSVPSGFTSGWTNTVVSYFGSFATNGFGSFTDAPPANKSSVSKYTSNFTGKVDHVVIPYTSNTTSDLKCVIYSDSSGPSSLLGTSPAITSGTAGEVTFDFSALTVNVVSGTSYWIGIISDTTTSLGVNRIECPGTTAAGITFVADSYASPASTFPGGSSTVNFRYPIKVFPGAATNYTLTSTQGSYTLTGKSAVRGQKVVFIKSGTSWVVPGDFSSTNSVEVLGAGANGTAGIANTSSGASGGSAGYSKKSNVTLTPGSTIVVQIAAANAGSGVDTYMLNNSGAFLVRAQSAVGNAAATTVRAVGDVITAGSAGRLAASTTARGGMAGAGAPGPLGLGTQPVNTGANLGAAGGGAANTGTSGTAGTATTGGNGGDGPGGSGHGVGATSTSSATAGSADTGSGGGGGCTTAADSNGANGSQHSIWTQTSNGETAGPGGGGGGGGSSTSGAAGGNAGGYGAGGGGGGVSVTFGGAAGTSTGGIIVVTYTPVANLSLTSAKGTLTLAGQTAGVNRFARMSAVQGVYSLVGKTVLFPVARKLVSAQGSYSLVGETANLNKALRLSLAQGGYSLTGETAILAKGVRFQASHGFYHVIGRSANRNHNRRLHANPGHFHVRRQKVILRTGGHNVTIWPVDTGEYDLVGVDAIFGHEVFKLTFSEFINTDFQDWAIVEGADYDSFLNTMYVTNQDVMTFAQTPYLYVFLEDGQSQDDTSLLLTVARDWAETGNTPKTGEALQVYKYRNGFLMSVSKNRFRGKGRVYQLQFTSEPGKDFNLRGWAVWSEKNSTP